MGRSALVSYQPRPHISHALQHLSRSVTVCAAALCLSLICQVGVWAMVHFTEARVEQVGDQRAPEQLKVVRAEEAAIKPPPGPQPSKPAAGDGAQQKEDAPAEVNTVIAASDIVLRRAASIVRWAGVISALGLALFMFQSVIVAGGAAVPGVERAVTAATLAYLAAALCVPVSSILPDAPLHGLFASYDALIAQSQSIRGGAPESPGAIVFYGTNLIMPITVIVMVVVTVLRLREGIEAGIIVTAVSQLDERIEREIRAAKLGQLAAPRAVGALNAAIGEEPVYAPPAPAPQPIQRQRAVEPVPVAPPAFRSAEAPPMETYKPGDSTRRPI